MICARSFLSSDVISSCSLHACFELAQCFLIVHVATRIVSSLHSVGDVHESI